MSLKSLIVALVLAGMIAAGVKVFVAPKLGNEGDASAMSVKPETATSEANTTPEQADTLRRNAVLSKRADGHYWARMVVNKKTTVEFMVDTGASVVALTFEDARRMGLKPDELDYSWRISTAGGETMGASVLIDSLKINQVHIRDVEAMVLRSDLEQSLLGMSYLSKLYSYEFRGDRLIIRQ